jgi:hypothetical protein
MAQEEGKERFSRNADEQPGDSCLAAHSGRSVTGFPPEPGSAVFAPPMASPFRTMALS